MKKLSSDMTWIMKFGFTTLWIGGFGLGTIATFFSPETLSGPPSESSFVEWQLLLAFFAGTAFIYWFLVRLKKVSLEGREFVISNLRKEIRVNLNDVEKVTSSVFFNPEIAWLHLKAPSDFGLKIQFMPPYRYGFRGSSGHPLIRELNDLIESGRNV